MSSENEDAAMPTETQSYFYEASILNGRVHIPRKTNAKISSSSHYFATNYNCYRQTDTYSHIRARARTHRPREIFR